MSTTLLRLLPSLAAATANNISTNGHDHHRIRSMITFVINLPLLPLLVLWLCMFDFFPSVEQAPVSSSSLSSSSASSTSQLDYILFAKSTYGKNLAAVANEKGLVHFEANFSDFLKKYNKVYYDNEEIEYRKGNFLYSLDLVNINNREYNAGRVPYRLSLNRFSDFGNNENFFISQKWINPEYIQSKYNLPYFRGGIDGWQPKNASTTGNQTSNTTGGDDYSERHMPKEFDWRTKGVVSPVQDQGPCGSCWIFAALSVVESANALAKNPLVDLSKQQIMDCVKPPLYVSDSCSGGTADDVYNYVQQFGVVTAQNYPYTGKPNQSCRLMAKEWKEWIYSYKFLPVNATDDEIMWALYHKGPLAAIINAGDRQFQLYSGGVITNGGDRNLYADYNHYVTIVGWGSENGYPYWLVKNSWGTEWGEEGYIKLARGINNRGINTVVSYAEARQQPRNYNQTVDTSTESNTNENVNNDHYYPEINDNINNGAYNTNDQNSFWTPLLITFLLLIFSIVAFQM